MLTSLIAAVAEAEEGMNGTSSEPNSLLFTSPSAHARHPWLLHDHGPPRSVPELPAQRLRAGGRAECGGEGGGPLGQPGCRSPSNRSPLVSPRWYSRHAFLPFRFLPSLEMSRGSTCAPTEGLPSSTSSPPSTPALVLSHPTLLARLASGSDTKIRVCSCYPPSAPDSSRPIGEPQHHPLDWSAPEGPDRVPQVVLHGGR